jgi:hypothetical protein
MKKIVNSSRSSVAEQVVDFLNSRELLRPENLSCESCGSKMEYKEFQFWLAGTGMSWNMRLPVCAKCAQKEIRKALGQNEAA